MMTTEQAQAFRAGYAKNIGQVSRASRGRLIAELRDGLNDYSAWSKDELIAAVMNRRGFGIERYNESTHVAGHVPSGQKWDACPYCTGEWE